MWASMFKEEKLNPIKIIQDVLNIVKYILVLLNSFWPNPILDWLIKIMPTPEREPDLSPSH